MGESAKARREQLSKPDRHAELLAAGARLLVRAAEVAELANATHGAVARRADGFTNIHDGRGAVYTRYRLPVIKLPGRQVMLYPVDSKAKPGHENTVRYLGLSLMLFYRDADKQAEADNLPIPPPTPDYVLAAARPVALGVEQCDAPYNPGLVKSISGTDLVLYQENISLGVFSKNYTEFPVWTTGYSVITKELENWEVLPHLPAEGLPPETFEYHEAHVDNMSGLLEEIVGSLHDPALNPRPRA